MSLEYTRERLYMAIATLATSTASLQDRLLNAYWYIAPIGLDTYEVLPAGVRDTYRYLVARLTEVPGQGSESAAAATTRLLSDDTATELIECILDLYEDVTALLGPA